MTISSLAAAALRVINAAWVNGTSYDLASQAAYALESAQMPQSPETAAETERLRARVAELEQQATPVCPVCQNPGCCCRCFGKSPRPDCGHGQSTSGNTSPWQRAVDGLNALAAAGVPMHVEPDGRISNPCGDEHIVWDRAAERWHLVHDEDDADEEPHPEPREWPASPDCTCADPVPYALTPQATSALAHPAVDKLRSILAPSQTADKR